jgi:hypothetical protein
LVRRDWVLGRGPTGGLVMITVVALAFLVGGSAVGYGELVPYADAPEDHAALVAAVTAACEGRDCAYLAGSTLRPPAGLQRPMAPVHGRAVLYNGGASETTIRGPLGAPATLRHSARPDSILARKRAFLARKREGWSTSPGIVDLGGGWTRISR